MPGLYEYTISMTDKASGTLQKLTGSSFEAVQKFVQLDDKTAALKNHLTDFGNGISALKQKIDILQGEKELIDSSNLTQIRQYNKEIASLNQEITKLETDTGSSKIGKNLKDAVSQIPGAGLLANPLVMAGAGIAAIGKLSVSWEEGMAKINATAQLPQQELNALSNKIKQLGVDAGADLSKVPDAYEKIISQTGDVALSTDILATALKGAKAGFTDVDVVAGAVGQSLSAIGKGKETAAEVMDVLFAAKRVGAGEFSDFANNIPGLIASGQNVGATFREVSGAFAYMTGKGNDASSSTMLLQNAFTALGKSEITGGLKAAGVEVYDTEGKMRGLLPIMTDLSKLMNNMSDQQRSDFLESIGLKDAQAKQAFSVLTNDTNKLKEAMDATANASGELQAALENTNNPANKMKESWAKIQGIALNLGGVVVAVLNPVLTILGGLLSGVAWVVNSVGTAWSWWTGLLQQGNPYIVGLTILIGGLTAAVALHNLWLQKDVIWTGITTAAKATWAAVTGALTVSQWGLNTAMLANPAVWVVVGIMALVGAFVAAWNYSEKFRGAMYGIWEVMKGFGNIIKEFVIDRIKGIFSGLGSLASAFGKLVKLDFSGAKDDAVKGLADLSGTNAIKNAVDSGKELGGKFKAGYADGVANFQADKAKKDKPKGLEVAMPEMPAAPDMSNFNYDELMAKLNPDKKKKASTGSANKAKKDDTLSLGTPQDYNQTGLYGAINQKFGVQADLAMSGASTTSTGSVTDPKTKPVITMASRVDEISMSLKRMAAAAAIPVALGLGAGNVAANEPLLPQGADSALSKTTAQMVAPTKTDALLDSFDYTSQMISNDSYDNSTITNNDVKNNRTDAINRVSTVNNTDQGKTIKIDRFTDKIEIHIHTSDTEAGKAVADNVRDEVERALAEILNV